MPEPRTVFAIYAAFAGLSTLLLLPRFRPGERWMAAIVGLVWPIAILVWVIDAAIGEKPED